MDRILTNKMSDKNPELVAFLTKYGALVTYVIIGLIGKFGFDIVAGKRLSGWYVLGTGCMSIFIGWIVWVWCQRYPGLNPGIVVPIATLVSRDIMLFITMIDYMGVLKLITGKNTKKEE